FRSSDEPSEYPIRFHAEAEAIGKLDDLAVQRADLGAPADVKIADHRRPMTGGRRDHLFVKNFSIFCRAGKGEGDAERATANASSIARSMIGFTSGSSASAP